MFKTVQRLSFVSCRLVREQSSCSGESSKPTSLNQQSPNMSNFSMVNLLRTPHPGPRVGHSALNRQPLDATFSYHVQNHMSGPPGAHTVSLSSASASSSGGIYPGHVVPQTYLYNPNLAIANWVNQPQTYMQAGGTFVAWSQPQTLQNPLQSQEPPSTTQLHAIAPSTSQSTEYLPLEETNPPSSRQAEAGKPRCPTS